MREEKWTSEDQIEDKKWKRGLYLSNDNIDPLVHYPTWSSLCMQMVFSLVEICTSSTVLFSHHHITSFFSLFIFISYFLIKFEIQTQRWGHVQNTQITTIYFRCWNQIYHFFRCLWWINFKLFSTVEMPFVWHLMHAMDGSCDSPQNDRSCDFPTLGELCG